MLPARLAGAGPSRVTGVSAAYIYSELRDDGDYCYSVTIPALIGATYGGGTGSRPTTC